MVSGILFSSPFFFLWLRSKNKILNVFIPDFKKSNKKKAAFHFILSMKWLSYFLSYFLLMLALSKNRGLFYSIVSHDAENLIVNIANNNKRIYSFLTSRFSSLEITNNKKGPGVVKRLFSSAVNNWRSHRQNNLFLCFFFFEDQITQ